MGLNEKTILIIDDNVDFQLLAARILQKHGYKVKSLFDAQMQEVLSTIHTCDIVLLDFDLPSAKGTEISSQLKHNNATTHIPIIMVTGNAEVQDLFKDARADACLIKPFPMKILLERIREFLSNSLKNAF